MSEYKQVKIGKLKFKGSSDKARSKKKKKRKIEKDEQSEEIDNIDIEDANKHEGWWLIKTYEQLNGGPVVIQLFNNSFIFANDNGTLSIGEDGSQRGPQDEEVFTMIRISDTKVAFKSGYGKYMSVNARGEINARVEAVGPQEQIEVVIQDGKLALQGHNGYFFTVADDNEIKSLSRTAKEKEMVCLRTNRSRVKKKKSEENEEETGDVRMFEINYVKQFQSFGDHKLKIHEGPASSLESARKKGRLHEAMLDRREKMKADRYCK